MKFRFWQGVDLCNNINLTLIHILIWNIQSQYNGRLWRISGSCHQSIHEHIGINSILIPQRWYILPILVETLYSGRENNFIYANTNSSWISFMQFVSQRCAFMGDFNSHHHMWGSNICCPIVSIIAYSIQENMFSVLNVGLPIRLGKPCQSRNISNWFKTCI